MKIIANKSILHNNISGCTFVASQMDEDVQTGTRENDSHIEWMGDLTIAIGQHIAPLINALTGIKQKINSTLLMLMAHPDNEPDSEFSDRISDLEEVLEIIKNAKGL